MAYLYGQLTHKYKLPLVTTLLVSAWVTFIALTFAGNRKLGLFFVVFSALVGVIIAIVWNLMKMQHKK